MIFEKALERMREGHAVKRACWKNEMHLTLTTGNSYSFHKFSVLSDNVTKDHVAIGSELCFLLCYGKDDTSSKLKWIPLQSDLLALDWTFA